MKYARKCSVTGEGMNAGWVWYDGTFYTKYEKDTALELHKDFDEEWKCQDWSDQEIIEMAYESGVLYWTEWEDSDCEDDFQFETDES